MAASPAGASRPLAPDWFSRTRLKLRHLQLLTALDEDRNLNRAARRLGLTQPAASRLLAEIEAMIGAPVVERRPRGVEPNALGEVLLRRARAVLVELEAAAAELNGLRGGSGGTVAIGAVTMPAVDALVRLVEQARREAPGIRVSAEVDTSPVLVERLRAGRLDFILARLPAGQDAAGLEYREVGEEEICFLVREEHPLLAGGTPALADLRAYPWVLEPRGSLLRQQVEMLFLRHGLEPPGQVLNTASALVALAALARGDAIGAVSTSVAAIFGPRGRFRRLPAPREAPRLSVPPYGLIRLRGHRLSPAAHSLHAMAEALLFEDIPKPA